MTTPLALPALTERTTRLGSGDIAAVLGVHPTRTALDVYMAKRGLVEETPEDARMHWGKRLEGAILEEYRERHRIPADKWLSPCGTMAGAQAWITATPDAIVCDVDGVDWQHGVEAKTAGLDQRERWGESGTDAVPIYYAAQCHWLMIVTGLPWWDLPVLIAGNEYREYRLDADPALHAQILLKAGVFWHEHVLAGVHPPFVDPFSASRFLAARYPTHDDVTVQLADPDTEALFREYEATCMDLKNIELRKAEIEVQFKERIGEHREILTTPTGHKASWARIPATRVEAHDRKAYRRIFVKVAKEKS